MVRFRKTVIAAVALSALALTPTAAYAHDHHGALASTEDSGMSWGYYSDDVIDFTTTGPDVFKDARASAIMIGMDDRSFFRLRVTGIDKSASREEPYGVHLHQGTCDATNPGLAGIHYNVTWHPLETAIPLPNVTKKNEIWLDLDVDSEGNGRSTATVSFIPEEGTRSIVLHAAATVPDGPTIGTAGARLACLPFKIKVYGN